MNAPEEQQRCAHELATIILEMDHLPQSITDDAREYLDAYHGGLEPAPMAFLAKIFPRPGQ